MRPAQMGILVREKANVRLVEHESVVSKRGLLLHGVVYVKRDDLLECVVVIAVILVVELVHKLFRDCDREKRRKTKSIRDLKI